jgi:F-type H+-transporting ATPase subunit delta
MTATAESELARLQASPTAQRVARVYAEALFEEAAKRNILEEVETELKALRDEVASVDPVLRSFFLGGILGRDRRESTLKTALAGKVSDIVLNFLLVLNFHDRLDLFRSALALYSKMLEERSNKARVKVISAAPLSDDQRGRLVNQLRDMTRHEPVLEETIDPELLGGMIVQVADWRYDASVRHQLENIRNQLIENSHAEIQAGRDRFSSADAN